MFTAFLANEFAVAFLGFLLRVLRVLRGSIFTAVDLITRVLK